MDIHNLTAKDIKKLHVWLRALIQVLYFLFIPSVYTAAFAGVKYIFTQIGAGEKVSMTSSVKKTDGTTNGSKTSGSDSVKTGDPANVLGWLGLAVSSLGVGMGGFAWKRRKRK